MKFTLPFLLLFVFLSFLSITAQIDRGAGIKIKNQQTGKIEEIKLYDGSFALVIGEVNYTEGWDKLDGVKVDVAEVSTVLQKHGFTVEKSENLTGQQLRTRVEKFINDYGYDEKNRLLIYYSGHGYTLKSVGDNRELGYIVPVDSPNPTKDEKGFRQTAINMITVQSYMREIQSKHALFVFDSCFSGKLFAMRDNLKIPPSISENVAYPIRQIITAGDENQSVPDESIFRKLFVRGLEGEADLNNDGYITGIELGSFLKEKVTNYTNRQETPRYGAINDPDLDRGDFVFTIPLKSTLVAEILDQTESKDSRRARLLVDQSLTEMMVGNYKKARGLINESLQLQENSAMAIGIRGWIKHNEDFDYSDAQKDLEKAVQLNANSGLLRLRLASLYYSQNKIDLAKNTASYSLKLLADPKTSFDYYSLGSAYVILDKLDEAATNLSKAIELNPQFATAYFNRGMVYWLKKDNSQSIRDFTKTIEINSEYAGAYAKRGSIYDETGNYNSAISDFTKAIELKSDIEVNYYRRGLCFNGKKNYEAAIKDFTKVIKINQTHIEAYYQRGLAHAFQQDYDASIQDFTKTIELAPDATNAYSDRGNSYLNKQNYDAAILDFKKAIELNTQNALAYSNLASAYNDKSNYYSAIENFTKAIELNPRISNAYKGRSFAYEKIGRSDLAQDDWKKYQELIKEQ